jgi:hypothetical protein
MRRLDDRKKSALDTETVKRGATKVSADEYDTEQCRWQGWIQGQVEAAETGSQRVIGDVHPLDEARGQVEEGPTSSEWALIAREHVMRTLLATGYFTADDLEPLGIPEHYRRSVHGLVTAFFRGKKPYMDEAGRRKSERPERKGSKNTVFRINAKGRRELPALLMGLQELLVGNSSGGRGASSDAAAVSDETPGADTLPGALTGGSSHRSAPGSSEQPLTGVSAGRPTPQGMEGLESQKPTDAHSGENVNAGVSGLDNQTGAASSSAPCAGVDKGSSEVVETSSASGGPAARLFDEAPPSAYDPYSEAA